MEIIDKMFNDNPYTLVSHHLDSYNDFFDNGLSRILMEKTYKNIKKQSEKTGEFHQCELYLGGKDGKKFTMVNPLYIMIIVVFLILCTQMKHV